VLDYGLTKDVFTKDNLEKAFGGVLRHFVFGGTDLHDDEDARQISVFTDDERPLVMYGEEDNMEHKSVQGNQND
jgi:manganese/iron transport system ATP-binding protein